MKFPKEIYDYNKQSFAAFKTSDNIKVLLEPDNVYDDGLNYFVEYDENDNLLFYDADEDLIGKYDVVKKQYYDKDGRKTFFNKICRKSSSGHHLNFIEYDGKIII